MPESRPAHRVFDGEMDEAECHALGTGEVAVFSCRLPGGAGPNEDSAAVLPFGESSTVLAVADGMGGERAGARASSLAIHALEQALAEAQRGGSALREAILDGIERANRAVCELGVGAGTTLAVVEVEQAVFRAQRGAAERRSDEIAERRSDSQATSIRPYHVGDSPILLIGQRGKLKLQTVAHSPVGFAVEAGWLDEGEAMHHEARHLVSNVLGAKDMRMEVGSRRRLAPFDTLLIASDGLSDNLRTEEIVALSRTGPLAAVCERLAELALTRMHAPDAEEPSKPDDLTIVAYRARRPTY